MGIRPIGRGACALWSRRAYDRPMSTAKWTYKLRLIGKTPDGVRMDRLARYIKLFAELLGTDNQPIFKGLQNASVGLKAYIPPSCQTSVFKRILQLKTDTESRPSLVMRQIESEMGLDEIPEAEVRDESDNVVYVAKWCRPLIETSPRIQQGGTVDGVVTGLIGADDTLHLYLRDIHSRDLKLVIRNVELGRALLQRFRGGTVRLSVHGSWIRTETGWVPEASKCYVDSFDDLDESPLHDIFSRLSDIPGNKWASMQDPIGEWERIRGLKQ